jgi:hypothetical protein
MSRTSFLQDAMLRVTIVLFEDGAPVSKSLRQEHCRIFSATIASMAVAKARCPMADSPLR